MKIKKLFTEYLAEPKEFEEKWIIVGFFAGVMLIFSAIGPVIMLLIQLRNIVALSIWWFAVMGSMVAWPVSYLLALKHWWRLSFNFGWLMYLSSENDKKRKAAKLASKTQHKTEEAKTVC